MWSPKLKNNREWSKGVNSTGLRMIPVPLVSHTLAGGFTWGKGVDLEKMGIPCIPRLETSRWKLPLNTIPERERRHVVHVLQNLWLCRNYQPALKLQVGGRGLLLAFYDIYLCKHQSWNKKLTVVCLLECKISLVGAILGSLMKLPDSLS